MNRRQKIIVSVTGIFLVLLILVGLTYAFFVTRIRGNNNPTSISVETANLVVEYTDGDSNGDGKADAYMAFEKIQPSDTITYTKVFNVENKGNDTASYSVILDEMTNEFERNQDLQYSLTRSGETDPVASGYLAVGTHQILISKVDIDKDEMHTYILTIKYDEAGIDQSVDMNKALSFKVDIDNERVTWDTATEGTLLHAIKTSKTDATMGSTEDDYGTSYYFMGEDSNNYVNFSGMCWKIIRVQGDGTVKMLLVSEDECQSSELKTGPSIGAYSGVIYSDLINEEAAYYEKSNVPDFLNDWANKTGSFISRKGVVLDTSKLEQTDFCNDTSIASNNPRGIIDDGTGNFGEYTNNSELATWWFENNVYGTDTGLKCNGKGVDNSKSTRVRSNIALLTKEEYELSKDALFSNFDEFSTWLMSPDNSTEDQAYEVNMYKIFMYPTEDEKTIDFSGFAVVYDWWGYVPVINIKSNVVLDKTITGQTGSSINPYEIG